MLDGASVDALVVLVFVGLDAAAAFWDRERMVARAILFCYCHSFPSIEDATDCHFWKPESIR